MELWIPITLAAAAIQTVRFMLQKQLRATSLSTFGATFARFGFGAPLAVSLVPVLSWAQGMPAIAPAFVAFALSGGLAQVLATLCTVALFNRRNFAVGLTFIKTEVIITALVGFVVLGDAISLPALGVILLGVVGVLALSEVSAAGELRLLSRSTALGLAGGFLFGISGVCYRGASLEVASLDPLMRAALTLAFVTTAQALGMALYMRAYAQGELSRVFAKWRVTGLVGLTSMLGSLGWFTAFTLQNVAYVKALAQIELLFGAIATLLFFKEKISRLEVLGLLLVALSVLGIVLIG